MGLECAQIYFLINKKTVFYIKFQKIILLKSTSL